MERKEAIEIVKNNFPNGRNQLSEALITLIPELKENGNRIRKELIEHFRWNAQILSDFDNKDVIAWLEKQGEQKPFWSEEDECRFNNLIRLIDNSNEGDATKQGFITFLNKIKSLKQHCWKPTEEQMQDTKENKKETKNKCPNYHESWGCATSPLKQCNVCPDYKLYN